MPSAVVGIGAIVSYEPVRRRDNPLAALPGASLAARPQLPVQLFAVLEGGRRVNSEPGFRIDYPRLPAGAGTPATAAERQKLLDHLVRAIRAGCLELAERQDRVLLRDVLDPLGIEVDLLDFAELPFELELDPELRRRLEETAER